MGRHRQCQKGEHVRYSGAVLLKSSLFCRWSSLKSSYLSPSKESTAPGTEDDLYHRGTLADSTDIVIHEVAGFFCRQFV